MYNELSTLLSKVENDVLESQQAMKAIFATMNEQLAKVEQETTYTVNSVLVELTKQSTEEKYRVKAIRKMVAELKFMQGNLDTMQNWKTESKQKYAEMHADYLDYKIKKEETQGQQEDQPKTKTRLPCLHLGSQFPRKNRRFFLQ